MKTKPTREAGQRSRVGKRQLAVLIEEAIIDAYGESEQRVGFLTMLEEHLAVPFATEILGTAVRVERVDLNDADEIVESWECPVLTAIGHQNWKETLLWF